MPKRLIEELLPLTEIGIKSSKSVSYGAIHAIHTWFARRPLAACRAATFAALVDAPTREDEREALLKLIIESLPRKAPQKKPHIFEEMRERIKETFEGRAPKVLDPFAGGGSLPLEAARLGCEAYAHDLNPNAVLTLLGTVDYPMRFAETQFPLPQSKEWFETDAGPREGSLVEAIEAWGAWVQKRAEAKLAEYYPSSPGETVVAYFWAKTIHCTNPTCGGEIPLVAHRWLSKRRGKKPWAYRLATQPDRSIEVEILRGDAAREDKPGKGTTSRGSAQCPFCPQTIAPDQVKSQFMAGEDGRMMLAVAYKKEGETGTFFRAATPDDREVFRRAAEALAQAEAAHDDPFFPLVPDEPFPEKALSIGPGRYGISTWGQMHNERQLLALTNFVQVILNVPRNAYI